MAGTKKIMKPSEIPAFVGAVIKAGCDICAIGHFGYVLGDTDGHLEDHEELDRIEEEFGDRDFLLPEIVAYLRSIGRYLDPGSPATHWTENSRRQ
jgi:hypothetical protein